MRLTTKGRFAVTAMLDIALLQEQGKPISLSGISQRQHISLSYLEQLFNKLRRTGLVDSIRGSHGGYTLAKASQHISVASIIEAVDEPIDSTQCNGKENCRGSKANCITHDLWMSVNHVLNHYLTHVNLADLVAQHFEKIKHDQR